ncbi:DUF3592 domain-containing protein [Microbulbifer harenosus]|uniref:DUF3592 domain-containing protein n=1 Tax=Microbulbifer harenosus TaxID=2576840 RepID=A0ABY2UCD7_9GAMM|nr:DUF3592 domain-containing protein [Microbulbifer harenosus]TLM72839.1 DUF3592 domain-containing protein [Microbulbifer harenosus]
MFGPILIIAISLILLIVLLKNAGKGVESKRWPTTRRLVVYNKVHTRATTTGSDILEGNRSPTSTLALEYSYTVNGKKYKSSTIKFLRGESNNFFIERIIGRKYPVGKKVNVYYNVRNPSEACLEPGLAFGAILGFLIVLSFLLCGVVFAVKFA